MQGDSLVVMINLNYKKAVIMVQMFEFSSKYRPTVLVIILNFNKIWSGRMSFGQIG